MSFEDSREAMDFDSEEWVSDFKPDHPWQFWDRLLGWWYEQEW